MTKFKNGNFKNTIKSVDDYDEDDRNREKDKKLYLKVRNEVHPRKIRADAEKIYFDSKSKKPVDKKTPFDENTTMLEKRWVLYIAKLKNNKPNLYRRLLSSRENITYILRQLTLDEKIVVKNWHYKRLPFEKQILRLCWRINKHRENKELFQKEKENLLLVLFFFREKLDIKIDELKTELIAKRIDINFVEDPEHLFYDKIKEKLIIEPAGEIRDAKHRTILLDRELHDEGHYFDKHGILKGNKK